MQGSWEKLRCHRTRSVAVPNPRTWNLGATTRLLKRSWKSKLFQFLGHATASHTSRTWQMLFPAGNLSLPPDLINPLHPSPLRLVDPPSVPQVLSASLIIAPSTCSVTGGGLFLSHGAVHPKGEPESHSLIYLQCLGPWYPLGAQSTFVE